MKNEEALGGEVGLLAGLDVAEPKGFHGFASLDAFNDAVPDEVDLGLGAGTVLQVGPGAQLVAAMNDGDPGGEAGEEQALLEGTVTAANHGHGLVFEERPVARWRKRKRRVPRVPARRGCPGAGDWRRWRR